MSENARLLVSEKVIYTIVRTAIMQSPAVYGLKNSRRNFVDYLLKAKAPSPIKIYAREDAVFIDVTVVLKNGKNIKAEAKQIQQLVKNAVQDEVGIAVSKVNVKVAGVK
jgi:Uncharacterized protein conserved in bacteria